MLHKPTIKLCPLSIGQRKIGGAIGNAVPELLDQRQSLFHAEPIYPKGF